MCDAAYKLTYYNVGVNGRISDGGIFRESNLSRALTCNSLNLTPNQVLAGRVMKLPFVAARWPHGCRRKYSEVAVPMLVGSNPTEGGGFFQRKEPPPGHGCVCMSIRG
jgi:hypothetical protein